VETILIHPSFWPGKTRVGHAAVLTFRREMAPSGYIWSGEKADFLLPGALVKNDKVFMLPCGW
jgi:hypothetical protein